jgi:thiosulfate/3-mercaptopyruvate sulfurtransferase
MKRTTALLVLAGLIVLLVGCPAPQGDVGTEIITAGEALELVAAEDAVLVDGRTLLDYRKGHIDGAVSISRADIVVNEPFVNMLAPADQIEAVMSERGISNDTLVVVYDDNSNMDSARLWWTLKIYGHDQVKVVSGGLAALLDAGAAETTVAAAVQPATFTAAALRSEMLATQADLRAQINEPDPEVVIIDTRSIEEYTEGTVPGAICLDYAGNNFPDGTYRTPRQIQIRYIEAGMDFDNTAIMYCKTSIRGAQTYLALYNAGYRDLKLYDAAWVEWSSNPMNEIYVPESSGPQLEASDAS